MGAKRDLQASFDADIVYEFMDLLHKIDSEFEKSVHSLRDPDMFATEVNALFRMVHNLKSSSSYLNIDKISKISTVVEDFLSDLRENNRVCKKEYIDWLLIYANQIGDWAQDLEEDKDLSKLNYKILNVPLIE